MDGLCRLLIYLVVTSLLTGCYSTSFDLKPAPKKDPEFYKYLTPEARKEHIEASKCLYFIKNESNRNIRIEPHCK